MTSVRRVSGSHAPDSVLVSDLVRVFRDARRELPFSLALDTEDEDRQHLSHSVLVRQDVWIVEVDERLAGFIAFAEGCVNFLFVAPEYQCRGIGRMLLDIAQKSNPELDLWAFEVNQRAIRFYERHGFRVVERTDGRTNEAGMPDVRLHWSADT